MTRSVKVILVVAAQSSAMWTVEPDACDELRPSDGSNLRPED